MTLTGLVEAFEQGTVTAFDHRAHVQVAWWALQRMTFEEASSWYLRHLRALVVRLQVPGKLHVTLTWAWLLALDATMREHPGLPFDALLQVLPPVQVRDLPGAREHFVLEALHG